MTTRAEPGWPVWPYPFIKTMGAASKWPNFLLISHCSSVTITVMVQKTSAQLRTVLHAWVSPLNGPVDTMLWAAEDKQHSVLSSSVLPLLFWSHSLYTSTSLVCPFPPPIHTYVFANNVFYSVSVDMFCELVSHENVFGDSLDSNKLINHSNYLPWPKVPCLFPCIL